MIVSLSGGDFERAKQLYISRDVNSRVCVAFHEPWLRIETGLTEISFFGTFSVELRWPTSAHFGGKRGRVPILVGYCSMIPSVSLTSWQSRLLCCSLSPDGYGHVRVSDISALTVAEFTCYTVRMLDISLLVCKGK